MIRYFVVLLLLAGGVQARTLRWSSLDVTAALGREGELHVVERHSMVFDGDWNGGERTFRVEPGQTLQLIALSADHAGELRPLTPASGAVGLDEYSWDGRRLRWRARRATDPPFRNEELTYVIEYTMRNVVERKQDHYILRHDFGAPARPGPIESYTLQFELDRAWKAAPGFTPSVERSDVRPGKTLIMHVPLRWSGEGEPRFIRDPRTIASAEPGAPKLPVIVDHEIGLVAVFLALIGWFGWSFIHGESRVGRYAPRPAPTRAWLEEHVFTHRAEVVGAAWDGKTGHGEVAALIATMTAEGKIANEPSPRPRLRLLVPRASLSEYERAFVDRLFVAGDVIEPKVLRAHYGRTGFDPAEAIRRPLHVAARKLTGHSRDRIPFTFGCLSLLIAIVAVPFLLGLSGGTSAGVFAAVAGITCVAVTLGFAIQYDDRPSRARAALLAFPALVAGAGLVLMRASLDLTLASLTLLVVVFWFIQRVAAWSGSAAELHSLQSLRAAREFLRGRLKRRDPSIEEHWIPHILAFGLGPDLDAWFISAPSRGASRSDSWGGTSSSLSSGGSETASSSMFVPGGGGFGGAGATGGWARSINQFAASVPAPAPVRDTSSSSSGSWSGSSSSSSSSSSGGSSSGGGGAGGW